MKLYLVLAPEGDDAAPYQVCTSKREARRWFSHYTEDECECGGIESVDACAHVKELHERVVLLEAALGMAQYTITECVEFAHGMTGAPGSWHCEVQAAMRHGLSGIREAGVVLRDELVEIWNGLVDEDRQIREYRT